jgi:Bacterial PH domain
MPLTVNREVFRLAPPLVLWWVWVVFSVANIADFAAQGVYGSSPRFAIVVSAILVTVTGLAYALALRPRVVADQAGLTIVNPFRDHHVPWAAIQAVDTGDWVQVHYAPARDPDDGSRARSSVAGKVISCWALYVSARTKRRAARAGPPPRQAGVLRPALPGARHATAAGREPGYGETSRLPEEAKYLASLPVAKAIAVRLDTRAGRERTSAGRTAPPDPVTARWAWSPVAAVLLPALALLIITLVR